MEEKTQLDKSEEKVARDEIENARREKQLDTEEKTQFHIELGGRSSGEHVTEKKEIPNEEYARKCLSGELNYLRDGDKENV